MNIYVEDARRIFKDCLNIKNDIFYCSDIKTKMIVRKLIEKI